MEEAQVGAKRACPLFLPVRFFADVFDRFCVEFGSFGFVRSILMVIFTNNKHVSIMLPLSIHLEYTYLKGSRGPLIKGVLIFMLP